MSFAVEMLMFVVGIVLQWVLEVAGAGGACWGMSEVWNMRGGNTQNPADSNELFRWVANIVFGLGFIRMFFRYGPQNGYAQAIVDPQDWIRDYGASKRPHQQRQGQVGDGAYGPQGMVVFEFVFFLLGVYLQWTLEVLGAGGACWGMSEVWHLRGGTVAPPQDPEVSNDGVRVMANIVFTIAAFRMLQKYCPEHDVHVAMNGPHAWLKDLGKNRRAQQKEIQMGDDVQV